jgi:hypothetical protein
MQQDIKRYTALGWHLLPIQPGGKRPILKDWVKAASSDPGVVAEWCRQWPGMNVGVACGQSGFFVIDVDRKNGGMGTFEGVQRSRTPFTPTLTARTAGGGLHLLYGISDDFVPRNMKLDKLGLRGIETRGDGGQIVIAPSHIAESTNEETGEIIPGGRYQWENSFAIAAPPRWLVELMTAKPTATQIVATFKRRDYKLQRGEDRPFQHVENVANKLARMPKDSGRNNFLSASMFAMLVNLRGKIDPMHIARRMLEAGIASGLDRTEVEKTINSAFNGAASRGMTFGVKSPSS